VLTVNPNKEKSKYHKQKMKIFIIFHDSANQCSIVEKNKKQHTTRNVKIQLNYKSVKNSIMFAYDCWGRVFMMSLHSCGLLLFHSIGIWLSFVWKLWFVEFLAVENQRYTTIFE
jgi:hypothetical protein